MCKKGLNISLVIFFLFFLCGFSPQAKEDLSEFLKPKHFIDSNNPKIIAKATELTKGCKTEAEKVKELFEFVRDTNNDNICESFVASDVLECGGNSCRKRSILLTALGHHFCSRNNRNLPSGNLAPL